MLKIKVISSVKRNYAFTACLKEACTCEEIMFKRDLHSHTRIGQSNAAQGLRNSLK